jgi:hypothetical protein
MIFLTGVGLSFHRSLATVFIFLYLAILKLQALKRILKK